MGADIHIFAEVKQDGKWIANRDSVFPDTNWRTREDGENEYNILHREPQSYRKNAWFAFLADVRNYFDVDTLVKPRGIPKDASPEWIKYTEDWEPQLHSISYLRYIDFEAFPGWQHMIDLGEGAITYKDLFENEFVNFIDPLKILTDKYEDARIVFGFDH